MKSQASHPNRNRAAGDVEHLAVHHHPAIRLAVVLGHLVLNNLMKACKRGARVLHVFLRRLMLVSASRNDKHHVRVASSWGVQRLTCKALRVSARRAAENKNVAHSSWPRNNDLTWLSEPLDRGTGTNPEAQLRRRTKSHMPASPESHTSTPQVPLTATLKTIGSNFPTPCTA